MTDRELMQQALEALTAYDGTNGVSKRKRVLAALRERLAQQEQEPFCYHDGRNIVGKEFADHSDVFPLYVAPRQWQGLTVEEIWACNAAPAGHHVECHICAAHQNVLDFAEAIAAKLKEKNNA